MKASERITQILDYLHINAKAFATTLGYERPQIIYDVLKGKTKSISLDLADKIVAVYTDINKVWLLTGIGNMLLTPDDCQQGVAIPYYNNISDNTVDTPIGTSNSAMGGASITSSPESAATSTCVTSRQEGSSVSHASVLLIPTKAQGGTLNDFTLQVTESDCERMISPVQGADFALQVAGVSMAPEYPDGSRVFVKRIKDNSFIEWGKVFVLDTCNGTVLKVLTPSDKENCVRCISLNPDPRYAPFDVNMNDVYGIYRVLLCMSMK